MATTPGAHLVFEVNTTRTSTPEQSTMSLLLAHLMSYTSMGRARVACESGCTCDAVDVDAHHSPHVSTVYLQALMPTQAPICHIGVTVLNETSSGGHKFKVGGREMAGRACGRRCACSFG